MVESSSAAPSCAIGNEGPFGPNWSPKFSRVAKALWPRKTAAELAYRTGVTERAAKRWLSGDRKPSADAVAAIVNEMLE